MVQQSRGKIRLYFKSGAFKAYPQDFQDALLAAFQGSIEEGTTTFMARFISSVARKTGKFRKWFRTMISSQSDVFGDTYRVTLRFKAPPSGSYFIYHVPFFGKSRRFKVGRPYKQPTTPHTKPIGVKEVLNKWSEDIEKSMIKKFSQLGMEIKTAVSAKWYAH